MVKIVFLYVKTDYVFLRIVTFKGKTPPGSRFQLDVKNFVSNPEPGGIFAR
jgi:hypothetical protein